MGRHPGFSNFVLVAVTVVLIHCGGGVIGSAGTSSSAASSSTGSTSVSSEVVGGSVSELTTDSNGLMVDLSDVSESENVMLLLYSYNSSSTIQGFQVSSEAVSEKFLGSGDTDENVTGDDGPSEDAGTEIEGAIDLTGAFHDLLRGEEKAINSDAIVASPSAVESTDLRYATTSTQKTFKVLNSFSNSSSYETVTATLRYSNDIFEFYVDDRDADTLSDDDLSQLADGFTAVIPKERQIFGNESDVNGDGKFAVLFTEVVNKLGGSAGGIVTGFFYAVDLFDTSQYSMSNEMEMYYTFVPDPNGDHGSTISQSFALTNILPGVLPHEYQHMINFNEHYFLNGGSAEIGWLNEGLSHLAEDIHSIDADDYMTTTGLENPARVASYLNSVSNICFSCGTSLSQRGGSYLFLRYLYEQAQNGALQGVTSGNDFLGKLLDTNERGITNVVHAAIGSGAVDADFKSLVGPFSLALYLSNTGLTTSSQLNLSGINLRSIQDDNRGTVLSGPALQTVSSLPFTDTLTGNGVTYLQLSGSTIKDAGGVLHFNLDAGADFGGYVIRQ